MNHPHDISLSSLERGSNLLFRCITGSRAYGLEIRSSDTDFKGVFIQPKSLFYSISFDEQISNASNDIIYYEIRRFAELLSKSNPNIIELLEMPDDCVTFRHPLFQKFESRIFLSRQCLETFGNYALQQIRKARGLNKKILNPMEMERKTVLNFCFVAIGQKSVPLKRFLKEKGFRQEDCGLVNILHMHDVYALFHDPEGMYKGIISGPAGNDVMLSSVPKGEEPIALMSFNRSGYSTYCKNYREYWTWVGKRNEARYENTISHGKHYDAKNMMHTFRLLNMAEEIGKEGKFRVRRPERDFLLRIRTGEFEYETLLRMAEDKLSSLKEIYRKADLPDKPDTDKINNLLIEIRETYYTSG